MSDATEEAGASESFAEWQAPEGAVDGGEDAEREGELQPAEFW